MSRRELVAQHEGVKGDDVEILDFFIKLRLVVHLERSDTSAKEAVPRAYVTGVVAVLKELPHGRVKFQVCVDLAFIHSDDLVPMTHEVVRATYRFLPRLVGILSGAQLYPIREAIPAAVVLASIEFKGDMFRKVLFAEEALFPVAWSVPGGLLRAGRNVAVKTVVGAIDCMLTFRTVPVLDVDAVGVGEPLEELHPFCALTVLTPVAIVGHDCQLFLFEVLLLEDDSAALVCVVAFQKMSPSAMRLISSRYL